MFRGELKSAWTWSDEPEEEPEITKEAIPLVQPQIIVTPAPEETTEEATMPPLETPAPVEAAPVEVVAVETAPVEASGAEPELSGSDADTAGKPKRRRSKRTN